jgi:hypothetical protein
MVKCFATIYEQENAAVGNFGKLQPLAPSFVRRKLFRVTMRI